MPSRNTTATKRNTETIKEKPTKEKPIITVNKNSSPEDILHSSWAFLNVVQFFNTFRTYFNLQPISIEKLERALLLEEWSTDQDEFNRESSVASNTSSQPEQQLGSFLVDFLIQIIRPLVKKKKTELDANTLNQYLFKLFPEQSESSFKNKTILEKIKILKDIQDLHMESADEKLIVLKNEQLPDALRVTPLGTDYQGWNYWYFGDTRLYREIPIPCGKRGTNIADITDFTFELLCSTEEEWHQVIKKFQPSNRTSSKELATKICDIGLIVIGKLEAKAATIARHEAKLKRAKELELIPKKRSRRLEVKFDEEAKRQKVLEVAQQQAELEEFERKEKMKSERKAAEEEKQELRTEEARLRSKVHDYITELISNGSVEEDTPNLKLLRNQLSKKATEYDRILKMQQWIKLVTEDISLDKGDLVKFVSSDMNTALNHVLFKNTLRIYLMTLMKFHTEPDTPVYNQLDEVRKSLILNRFHHLNDFCIKLNGILKEDPIQPKAIDLLHSVFYPKPIKIEEKAKVEDLGPETSVEIKQEAGEEI